MNVEASVAAAPKSTVTVAQTLSADRRKAGRPWEGNRVAAAAAPKTRASTRVAIGAEDTEWKEF